MYDHFSRLTQDLAESLHSGCALVIGTPHPLVSCPNRTFALLNAHNHLEHLRTLGHIVDAEKVQKAFAAATELTSEQYTGLIEPFLDVLTSPPDA